LCPNIAKDVYKMRNKMNFRNEVNDDTVGLQSTELPSLDSSNV